jgi:hypothetical protein
VFTGACTAMKETKGKTLGKKCLADIYGMVRVTPETITYIAVLVSCPSILLLAFF